MTPRLSSELVQSLRVTLQKIDEDFPRSEDEPVVAELKRLLLLRLAELESADTNKIESDDVPIQDIGSGPVVLVRMRSN